MDAAFDRRVLGGQPKRIEAHGEHHVVTLHPHEARAGIARRHRVPMPDVQVAAGVGQHGQRVKLFAHRIDLRAIQFAYFPFLLPLRFNGQMIVTASGSARGGDRRLLRLNFSDSLSRGCRLLHFGFG